MTIIMIGEIELLQEKISLLNIQQLKDPSITLSLMSNTGILGVSVSLFTILVILFLKQLISGQKSYFQHNRK